MYTPVEARDTDIPSTFSNSLEWRSRVNHKDAIKAVNIRFITSPKDKIPDSLLPAALTTAIDRGRTKYLFRGMKIPDEIIMNWITEGKLTTIKNPIRRVDKAIVKKSRNGFQERAKGGKQKIRILI